MLSTLCYCQKTYPKVSVIGGDTITSFHSDQIRIINEDYEDLKYYRIQFPLALQRIDTLQKRVDVNKMKFEFVSDQLQILQQKDALHQKRNDELAEQNFNVVMENEKYQRHNRFWKYTSGLLAASLITLIFRP